MAWQCYKQRSIRADFNDLGLVVPDCGGIGGVGANSAHLDGVPKVLAQSLVRNFNLGDTTIYSGGNSLPRPIRNIGGVPNPTSKPMRVQ